MTNAVNIAQGGTNSVSWRNRIINGAMVINQRATTVTADLQYTVDRWRFGKLNDAVESIAQSTDAPSGFVNSLKNTVGTADTSISALQYSNFKQAIEGFNIADLGFGTSSAKPVTLSFWVKSSVVGLYSGNICNYAEDRICPFTYTVSSANTWEYKTYTFQGDTSGTWPTNNGGGLSMYFYMALGSNYYNGTAGTWGTSPNYGAGGAALVNVLATAGNSFAITGVQLEAGTVASPFERRDYGRELIMCQRYYQKNSDSQNIHAALYSGTTYLGQVWFPTNMRTLPTCTVSGGNSGSATVTSQQTNGFAWYISSAGSYIQGFTASAEL